jgi:small subunit ribosomal protein S14
MIDILSNLGTKSLASLQPLQPPGRVGNSGGSDSFWNMLLKIQKGCARLSGLFNFNTEFYINGKVIKNRKQAAKSIKLSDEERSEARRKLEAMPRNSCENRTRLRCKLSGRPRGNYAKFQLSRMAFRAMALKGLLPGVTKASW